MLFETSIVIQRPIAEVFKIATCRDRCVVWQSSLLSSIQTEKTADVVGTIFEQETAFLGKHYKNRSVVTVNEPPHRFAFEEVEGPFGYQAEFRFAPTTEDGTTFSVRVESNMPTGLLKLIPTAILKAGAQHHMDGSLRTLKGLMENGVDPLTQLQSEAH